MTEFTPEYIRDWKTTIKIVSNIRGNIREIEKFALEALDEIERQAKRIAELEKERNNKCSDCCYVNPILDFWKNDTEYDDLPQPPKEGE